MKQTLIITGSSTGFGKELALKLAEMKQINLVATARNISQLDYLDEYNHGQILKLQLDVTNKQEIKAVVKKTLESFQTIDVLVNNAGLGYFATFEESDLSTVKYMMDVNLWGLVDVTREVLPVMRKQNSGTIINFSSIGGLYSFPTLSFYHATKYAVEGVSESLAKELERTNIKVMLIEPSGFRTDWAGRSSDKVLPAIDDYKYLTENIESSTANAHQEAGDPAMAAQIIIEQVTNNYDELPLRLPLGKVASDLAIEKYEQELQQFKQLQSISYSADQ